MQPPPAQPLLLLDRDRVIFDAANRVLERLGRWRPVVLIPQPDAARQYLCDAFVEERIPAVIIIRAGEGDDTSLSLLDWIRDQPEPLHSACVLVICDAVVDEGQEALDVWIENALCEALSAPAIPRASGQGLNLH
jgi:hypothetical protein